MGNRRLGRKRLFSLEKLGKSMTASELGIGVGMEPALVRATQNREGSIITTEIVLNLGTSKAAIASIDTDANYVIGVSAQEAHIFDSNDVSVFGRLLEVEMVCFEDLLTGDDDVILAHHSGKLNGLADGAAATNTGVDQTDWNAGTADSDSITYTPGS